MCLITTESSPCVAKQDITVCKVVAVPNSTSNCWRSAFMLRLDKKFPFDKTITEKTPFEINCDCEFFTTKVKKVCGGCFHSYELDKENYVSKFVLDFFPELTGCRYVVCRCTIPKGTEYYTGTHGDIASKSIIVHNPKNYKNVFNC